MNRSYPPAFASSLAAAFLACAALLLAGLPVRGAEAPNGRKNWSPPAFKIKAQALVEDVMAGHPELISATLHGSPPGLEKNYTMFAGSYLERIGNPDDPDDIMVIETGITILDPRWHRTRDAFRKFVVQLPLRDASGDNIGLLVLAYKNPPGSGVSDVDFLAKATKLRDELQARIPTYGFLFSPAG
jgi:hypothetical protein